jgi:hypothetical protein
MSNLNADIQIRITTLYRIISANRAGMIPGNSSLNANPKNPKQYFTMSGPASAPTFFMKVMPSPTAPDALDPGMNWFFRYFSDANGNMPDNTRTLHSAITGEKKCLERVDTATGSLKIAPVVKGKASQAWYIDFGKTTSDSIWFLQETAPAPAPASKDTEVPLGVPKPTRLDVLTGKDDVVARQIKGSPLDSTNTSYVEGTMWSFKPVRETNAEDEAGRGF